MAEDGRGLGAVERVECCCYLSAPATEDDMRDLGWPASGNRELEKWQPESLPGLMATAGVKKLACIEQCISSMH